MKQALLLLNLQNGFMPKSGSSDDFVQRLRDIASCDFDGRIWVQTLLPVNDDCCRKSSRNSPATRLVEGTVDAAWIEGFSPAPDDFVLPLFSSDCSIVLKQIARYVQENAIEKLYCAGICSDGFLTLNMHALSVNVKVYIVSDSLINPGESKEGGFWSCSSIELIAAMGGGKRESLSLTAWAQVIRKKPLNGHIGVTTCQKNMFKLLGLRHHQQTAHQIHRLPSHSDLQSAGLFEAKIINSVYLPSGKNFMHAACEVGDLAIVNTLLCTAKSKTSGLEIHPTTLRVTIQSACNLPNADLFGVSDPYVLLNLKETNNAGHSSKKIRQTKWVKNTLEPVWNETFVFLLDMNCYKLETHLELELEVYDRDEFGFNDSLGTLSLLINSPHSAIKEYKLLESNDRAVIHLGWQSVYKPEEKYKPFNCVKGPALQSDYGPKANTPAKCHVDFTCLTTSGHSILTLAAKSGKYAVMQTIISSLQDSRLSVNHSVCTEDNRTALMYACIQNQPHMVRLLLLLGANIYAMTTRGQTALHFACFHPSKKSIAIIRMILDHEVDLSLRRRALDQKDQAGWNAWHFMARSGILGMVNWKHQSRAVNLYRTVDDRTICGLTCLHIAILNNQYSTVKLLLHGKDLRGKRLFPRIRSNLKDQHGSTELDLALDVYFNSSPNPSQSLKICAELCSSGYYANNMAGQLCNSLLFRFILEGNVGGMHGLCRFDENNIVLGKEMIQTVQRMMSCGACTFTYTHDKTDIQQIMYFSKSRFLKICVVCRDKCFSENEIISDLQMLGLMNHRDCSCHLSGRCKSILTAEDDHVVKLTYIPTPLPIDKEKVLNIEAHRRDLVANIAAIAHMLESEKLRSSGWDFGKKYDEVNLKNPKLLDFDKLPVPTKEEYTRLASQLVVLVNYLGYEIVGPLPTSATLQGKKEMVCYGDDVTLPRVLSALVECIASDQHDRILNDKYLTGYRYAPMWEVNVSVGRLLDHEMVPFRLADPTTQLEGLTKTAAIFRMLLAGKYAVLLKHPGLIHVNARNHLRFPSPRKQNRRRTGLLSTTRQRMVNILLRTAARTNDIGAIKCISKISYYDIMRAKNASDKYRYTPLMYAVKRGHLEATKYILDMEVDIDYPAKNGFTPLILASYIGHLDIVKLLVGLGANIVAVDNNKMMAIHYAAYRNHAKIVRVIAKRMVELGYSVDMFPTYNYDPKKYSAPVHVTLHNAAKMVMRKLNILHALSRNLRELPSALHSNQNHFYESKILKDPLLSKVDRNHALHSLVKHVKKQSKIIGYSPLSIAVKAGNPEVVSTLLEFGANPLVVDESKKTPYERCLYRIGRNREDVQSFQRIQKNKNSFRAHLLKQIRECMSQLSSRLVRISFISPCIKRSSVFFSSVLAFTVDDGKNREKNKSILYERLNHSKKILKILNTNNEVKELRKFFAMRSLGVQFILMAIATTMLLLVTNVFHYPTALSIFEANKKILNLVTKKFHECDKNISAFREMDLQRKWWQYHQQAFSRSALSSACRGGIRLKKRQAPANFIFADFLNLNSSNVIKMLSELKTAQWFNEKMASVITIVNTFDPHSEIHSIIEYEIFFRRHGENKFKVSVKSFLFPKRIIDGSPHFYYSSTFYTFVLIAFSTLFYLSRIFSSGTRLISIFKLKAVFYEPVVLTVFLLTGATIGFIFRADLEATNVLVQMQKGRDAYVPLDQYVRYSDYQETFIVLLLICCLLEFLINVFGRAPVIGKYIWLVIHNMLDDVIIAYLQLFVVFTIISAAAFSIASATDEVCFKSSFSDAMYCVFRVLFAEEYFIFSASLNNHARYVVKTLEITFLIFAFIFKSNFIGLIGKKWKEHLDMAQVKWDQIVDEALRKLYYEESEKSSTAKTSAKDLGAYLNHGVLLLACDGTHHYNALESEDQAMVSFNDLFGRILRNNQTLKETVQLLGRTSVRYQECTNSHKH